MLARVNAVVTAHPTFTSAEDDQEASDPPARVVPAFVRECGGPRTGRTTRSQFVPSESLARTRTRRPQSVCQRERCPAGRVWRNGSRNGVGSRHGHPHYCDRRSRHRRRHRRDLVRSLITFPLAVSEEYGLLKLALRPTVPARERYHANPRPARRGNAPLRQTGSTAGPVFCRAAYGASGAARLGRACTRAGEDRQVGIEPDPMHATNAKRCQRPFMRAAATVRSRLASWAKTGERSMSTERHRCGVATRLLALQARRVSVCPRAGQISGRAAEAHMVRTGIRRQR
jgi:hypothetical protein